MNPPDLIEVLNSIPGIGPALPYILTACGLSAIASTMMPAPADPASPYGLVWRLVNLLAANWGHAKNAAQPAPRSDREPPAGGMPA